MNLRVLCALAASLVACGASKPPHSPASERSGKASEAPIEKAGSPSATDEPEYAFVSGRGRLFARPDPESASIAFDSRRTHADGWLYPVGVQILGRHGAYVEIETLAPPLGPLFCGSAHDLWMAAVRGFVPRDELLPVTTEPQTLEFDDGTWLTLARGVVVDPEAGVVEVQGARLGATLPTNAVADSYTGTGPFRRSRGDFYLLIGSRATYGPHVLPSELFARPFRIGLIAEEVEPVPERSNEYLATIAKNCVSARVRVRGTDLADSVSPPRMLDGSTYSDRGDPPPSGWDYPSLPRGRRLEDMTPETWLVPGPDLEAGYRISKGTRVYWPDGTPAGHVGDREFFFHWPPTARHDYACFLLYDKGPGSGELCFATTGVERHPLDNPPENPAPSEDDGGW